MENLSSPATAPGAVCRSMMRPMMSMCMRMMRCQPSY
jgi:hypothetical protein